MTSTFGDAGRVVPQTSVQPYVSTLAQRGESLAPLRAAVWGTGHARFAAGARRRWPASKRRERNDRGRLDEVVRTCGNWLSGVKAP